MIIVLKPEAGDDVAQERLAKIASCGINPLHMPGSERVVLGALGDERGIRTFETATRNTRDPERCYFTTARAPALAAGGVPRLCCRGSLRSQTLEARCP